MSEIKKIATRESFGKALIELGKADENVVVLDADLAGATKTDMFKKEFPDRHIDCGIAEANGDRRRSCNNGQSAFCKYICYVCCRPCF